MAGAVIGGIIGGVAGAINAKKNGQSVLKGAVGGALGGAVVGAATALTFGAATLAAGAVSGGAASVAAGMAAGAGTGAVAGAASGAASSAINQKITTGTVDKNQVKSAAVQTSAGMAAAGLLGGASVALAGGEGLVGSKAGAKVVANQLSKAGASEAIKNGGTVFGKILGASIEGGMSGAAWGAASDSAGQVFDITQGNEKRYNALQTFQSAKEGAISGAAFGAAFEGLSAAKGGIKTKIENSKGGRKTDFYVTPSGEAVPATGYRYMDSKYAEQTMSSMSAPGSYFGFEKFDSASAAQDAFQISPEWSDCGLRGEFDTLQVIDDMYVPKAYGDKGPGLEPFTRCYPEYGKGGAQQYIFKGTIKFKKVKLIGD